MSYAALIKEIGRGPKGSRPITADQAEALFGAMLDGQVPDLELKAKVEGQGLPASGVQLDSRAGVRYDLESHNLAVTGLEMAGPGLRATGEVRGTQLDRDPVFTGRLDLADAKPRPLLALLGIDDLATADPTVLGRLSAKLPFKAGASMRSNQIMVEELARSVAAYLERTKPPAADPALEVSWGRG